MRHFAVLAALMAACGGEALPRVCESGRTQACACVGGGPGAQVCALSGVSWGACVCGDGGTADVAGGDAGGDAGPGDAAVGDAPIDVAVGDIGINIDVVPGDADAGGDAAVDAPVTVDILPSGMCPEGYVNCIRNECSSLQRDPRVCGSCMYQCGAGADCVGGRCVTRATGVACDLGRGDCDGMAANGCETDTASDRMNCGGCGRACVSAREQCINGGCAPR